MKNMVSLRVSSGVLFIAAAALAQNAGTPLKSVPGFDLGAIDRAADPCKDFYQYACGTWLKNNPIPSDQASWGRFSELQERNETILRDILEAAAKDVNRGPDTQKIGDYYSACMDEKTIDSKGLEPLQTELDQIQAISNLRDLSAEIGRLHRIGVNVLFNFSSGQDFKDSNAEIGQADQGGLGLPEKDYYFRTDAKAVETRKEYVAHIARMLTMMGVADPAKQADTIMRLETEMAKMSMDITARRDPASVYHKMTMAEFRALSDSFDWTRYFTAIDAPKMDYLNVAAPDFFKGQEVMLKTVPMDDWKIYLAFHLDPRPGGHAADEFQQGKLQFLRHASDWGERTAAALEALRAGGGRRSRRSAGQGLCRQDLWRRG